MRDGALSEEGGATGHFGKKKQLHHRRGSGLLHVLTFDGDGQGASLGRTLDARLCHIEVMEPTPGAGLCVTLYRCPVLLT